SILSSYAQNAKVVHIEIDEAEIDKNVKTDVAILADAREALEALLPLVKPNDHAKWLDQFKELTKMEVEKVITPELYPQKQGLTMGEVVRRVNEETKGKGVIVTDVGQHQMIGCRYAKFSQTKSNVTSGGLGTMGFCLPAALGAKLARPDREVIAIIGDGGFQMTLQELGAIFQTQAAVKVIILNNQFLGMVRQWQQLFFDKRYSSTEMVNPDFVSIAAGFGIKGKSVDQRENLDQAVEEMFAHPGAFLLEVMVEKEDNVFPMVPTGASVSDVRLD
ncbi:MAG: thiamine pyrophosphate-dependent enzyme, partial [Bacteroidota bacterium]